MSVGSCLGLPSPASWDKSICFSVCFLASVTIDSSENIAGYSQNGEAHSTRCFQRSQKASGNWLLFVNFLATQWWTIKEVQRCLESRGYSSASCYIFRHKTFNRGSLMCLSSLSLTDRKRLRRIFQRKSHYYEKQVQVTQIYQSCWK